MTVLPSCGLMEFHVLQWCHPMSNSRGRTCCYTRIIPLYGVLEWIQARTSPVQYCLKEENHDWQDTHLFYNM